MAGQIGSGPVIGAAEAQSTVGTVKSRREPPFLERIAAMSADIGRFGHHFSFDLLNASAKNSASDGPLEALSSNALANDPSEILNSFSNETFVGSESSAAAVDVNWMAWAASMAENFDPR
jgi:hypothetical protein